MSAENVSDDEDLVYCQECGAEISRSAEICHECGVRQKAASPSVSSHDGPQQASEERQDQQPTGESVDTSREYSIPQWIAAIGVALVTFPVGLIVPVYLFYKAQNGTGGEQSGLEAWTAILFGIIGIVSVEIGGRTAAKVLWGAFVVLVAVGLVVVIGG